MRLTRLLGLTALIPVSYNAAPPAAAEVLLVPLCTGMVQALRIELPAGQPVPGPDNSACHIKGCHAGSSRKRSCGNLEPSQ